MYTSIAYHASHEQFAPSDLLKWVQLAESAGFDAIHSSDHFHPWSVRQAQSGFSFAWLGAAMQATSLPFSVVCAPGQRYHPAIVAQAVATLAEMFPDRFSVELGSGEALNECITGEGWPAKKERQQRLLQSARVIQSLLRGEKVSFEGLITVKNAKLYSLPTIPPPVFVAALSVETSEWASQWADGLLTTPDTAKDIKEKMMAFRKDSSNNKPVYVQFSFSYGPSPRSLDEAYDQWRTNLVSSEKLGNFSQPEEFDAATQHISKEEVKEKITFVENMDELFEKIQFCFDCGVERVILHNVNRMQELFIEDYKNYRSK